MCPEKTERSLASPTGFDEECIGFFGEILKSRQPDCPVSL